MKYLTIGAGGTGGCIGAYMTKADKDVTIIARGKQLDAIRGNGLQMDTTALGKFTVHPKITDTEHYNGKPDVIFVCVKEYSLASVLPFIKKVSDNNTVVIPILNVYGTGERLQKELNGVLVTDGCIYVAANIEEYGKIKMHGDIFRVVFGVRNKSDFTPKLYEIKNDLDESGIEGVLSDNIKRDTLKKFSYVSAQAACGLYYGVTAGEIQKDGEIRDCFSSLVHEIGLLAAAMGIDFGEDIVKRNLNILDSLLPTSSTSLQRDIESGKQSEIDGIIYSVTRMGEKYGLNLPVYKKVTERFFKIF